jgi:hypothetical protein
MSAAPDPYDHVEFRGRPMLNCDKAAVMKMEHHLGYELSIMQAIGNAPASAGYHAKGRMLDLVDWDAETKNRVAKKCGLASWIRSELDGMVGHLHQAVIFESRTNERGISSGGFDQIREFDLGGDGLTGPGKDRDPWRPSPRELITLDEYRFIITGGLDAPQPNNVTRMRDAMAEAIHDFSVAIQEGKASPDRPAVTAEVERLKKDRKKLRVRLATMPKR